MKRMLQRANVTGDLSNLSGDVTGLSGYVTGLSGNVSGLRGNIDLCELSDEERAIGVVITDLLVP